MKKILTLLVFFATISIFALLSFKFNLHALFSGMFAGSASWVVAHFFYENVKNKTFKRLWFWMRYKRVKEIKSGYCTGCFFDANKKCTHPKEHIVNKCVINKKIFAKRSYSRLNWLKKLFAFIIIAITISSCVTINVYK